MKFYFTYGTIGQDFSGGWTEIEAESMDQACELFEIVHPRRPGHGFINCGGIYPAGAFKKTSMYRDGNFGRRCVERITLNVERAANGGRK